jgi:hypothetical protein
MHYISRVCSVLTIRQLVYFKLTGILFVFSGLVLAVRIGP